MKESTLPYQSVIDRGYFTVSEVVKSSRIFTFAMVTPKGQEYLVRKLEEYKIKEAITVQVERDLTLV